MTNKKGDTMTITAKALRVDSILRRIENGETITTRQYNRIKKAQYRAQYAADWSFEGDADRTGIVALANRIDAAMESLTVPCGGEAHSNPYIDNCSRCAPLWGRCIDRTRVTG